MEGNSSGEAFCEADSHAVVAVPVVVSVLWALFCFFYHTRLLAVLLTWLINWLSTDTHISIGTFCLQAPNFINKPLCSLNTQST